VRVCLTGSCHHWNIYVWRCLLYPPYELTVVAGLLFSIYVFLFPPQTKPITLLIPTPILFLRLFILLVSVSFYSTGLGVQQSAGHINHSLQKKLISARYLPHITRFSLVVKKPHQPCLQLQLVFFLYSSLFHYRWLGFGTSLLVSVLKSISIRAFCLFL
jgi:hypothetical protein